ncbi:MAG: 23S rRNA (uracil(1939)-C(5))-methyltransferase RlmD, partial [Erysipelotrichaceae bacterium]|nr:23S rRNA (uracil(1939)-C(5))-methyltransferase RlmD [Erysipelotrichaceae bacterium]
FICIDASNYEITKKYDCIFVDPPRKGLDEKFIQSLIKSKAKKIVYISCNVGTLARDIEILKKYYSIESIDFVDMFPRTYHVETVALMSKVK